MTESGRGRAMVRYSLDKLRESILYISRRCENDPTFGLTKLTKVLFWSDFEWFQRTGEAITGSDYIAAPRGPLLEKQEGILTGMEFKHWLHMENRPSGGENPYRRPIANRAPDTSLFTAEELNVIDRVIVDQWGKHATELSDLSHRFIGWQVARPGERIPYGAASIFAPEITDDDIALAKELGSRLGSR
jgi:hypothetical protein